VHGVEQRLVQTLLLADCLERIVGARSFRILFVEHGRDAAEMRVLGQFFKPGREHGLEGVAMRAAVPEELDHFNLAGDIGRLRRGKLPILDARSGLGLGLCHARREKHNQSRKKPIQHLTLPENRPALSVSRDP